MERGRLFGAHNNMTIRRFLATAALFAVTATSALAAPVLSSTTVNLVADPLGGWSAGISATHTSPGAFTDRYTMSGIEGWAFVNGLFQTMGAIAAKDIDFTSASINGVALNLSAMNVGNIIAAREFASLPETLLNAPFVLEISGYAGEGYTGTGPISATYSGSLNFNVVPEPAGFALTGIALAAAALASRRRRTH